MAKEEYNEDKLIEVRHSQNFKKNRKIGVIHYSLNISEV